jgi:peptidoglycan/LPS O-acetylase OafA/YrhL
MHTNLIVLLKSLLLLPQDSKVVGGTGAPVLIVAWSLQYEIIFYATFATALINRWLFYTIAFVFLLNILLEPILGPYNFPRSMISSHLVLLFGMGMISSKILLSNFQVKSSRIIIFLSVFAFLTIGLIVSIYRESYFKPLSDLAYGLVSAILVISLVNFEKQGRTAPFIKQMAFLGDSSYALYLIHFPLVAIMSKIAIRILPMSVIGANLAFLFLVTGSVIVASAFNIFIEKPLLRRLTLISTLHRSSGQYKI